MSAIEVVVSLMVTSSDGTIFRPSFSMILSPTTMALDDTDQSLTQSQPVASGGGDGAIAVVGLAIPTLLIRILGGLLFVICSTILLGLWFDGRDPKSDSAEAKLASSHRGIFVEVQSFQPSAVPVVSVVSLEALIRIAERNACVILFAPKPLPTYRVQDETGAYEFTSQNVHTLEFIRTR